MSFIQLEICEKKYEDSEKYERRISQGEILQSVCLLSIHFSLIVAKGHELV